MGGSSEKKEHDSDASSSSEEDMTKPLKEERAGARRRRRQNSISISAKTNMSEKVATLKDTQELDPDDIRVLQTVAESEREEYEVRISSPKFNLLENKVLV
jgi:hypothetical protein